MPNTKEKGKLIEVLSKHISYGYATLCLIADELMADGVRLEEKRATSDGCITKAVREKLVELLDEAEEWADHKCDVLDCETCPADKMKGNCVQQLMVDRLIANGVTVQEWIPVTERLPSDEELQ